MRRSVRAVEQLRSVLVATSVLAAALAAALVAVATPVSAAPSAPPAAGGHEWVQTDHLGHRAVGAYRRTVSCVSPTECWAIDLGTLLRTTDGGSTWVDRFDLLPASLARLYDLSCVPAGGCSATGRTSRGVQVQIRLDPEGSVVHPMPIAGIGLECAASDRCVAVGGGQAAVTTDGGRHWTTSDVPQYLQRVSCVPGSHLCVAVGALDDRESGGSTSGFVAVSRDDGRTWTDRTDRLPGFFPGYGLPLYDVDCVSAVSCRAVGGDAGAALLTSADGGASWTAAALPAGLRELSSVACTSNVTCRTVGLGVADGRPGLVGATTRDGVVWTPDDLPGEGLLLRYTTVDSVQPDVACSGDLRCVAVGEVEAYRPAGAAHRWVQVPLPASPQSLNAVSCRDEGECVAVGAATGGAPIALLGTPGAFSVVRMPIAVGRPETVDCVGRLRCVVQAAYDDNHVGGRRSVSLWTSGNGGRTWSQGESPTVDPGYEQHVSCGTQASCVAIVEDGGGGRPTVLATRDGGASWQQSGVPGGPGDGTVEVPSVSCASATTCLALDGFVPARSGWRTDNRGSSWQPVRPVTGTDRVSRVACWATTCLAAGPDLVRSTDRGLTWSALPLPRQTAGLESLACSPSGRCVAVSVDARGRHAPVVTTDGGVSWRRDSAPQDLGPLLDCTADRCLSVLNTGDGVSVLAG